MDNNTNISIINRDGFSFPTIAQAKAANADGKGLRTNTGKVALYLTYGLLVAVAKKYISMTDAWNAFDDVNGNDVLAALSGNYTIPSFVDIYGAMITFTRGALILSAPSKLKKIIKDCGTIDVTVKDAKAPRLTNSKAGEPTKEMLKFRDMTEEERASRIENMRKNLEAKIARMQGYAGAIA